MKKYNLCFWLMALVGLFASCSQDETDALQVDNENNRVSLTASLPDDFAQIGTRALPTATDHQLRCILEVWTKDQTPTLKQRIEKVGLTGDNVVFDFEIEEGTYNCLFWADFIATDAGNTNATFGSVNYTHYDDKYYTTNDATNGLKAVSILTSAYASAFNTDARDAFFGQYELKKEAVAVTNPSIPALTRPFAKLTIKEKNSVNYGYCSGLTAVYDVPNTFNVSTGTVGNTTVQVTCSSKSTESLTLFSDYIFTDATSTLGAIELSFSGSKTFQPVTIPAGIPLKRNYKTNASGNLISEKPAPTNGVKLTVTMDAEWALPEEEINLDATVWDGNYPTTAEEAKAWLGAETSGADDVDGRKHVFTITTARQLAALHYLVANLVNLNVATADTEYRCATYKLAADIDLGNHSWVPIGMAVGTNYPFLGVFDGQGHTIRGMNITGDYGFSGFFTIVDGVVKHLNVKGKVAPSCTDANVYSGGIAGHAGYNGTASIAFCSFEGTIASATEYIKHAGGIAGEMTRGNILSCYAVITSMELTGTGGKAKGGIVGNVSGSNAVMQGCYWQTLVGITGAVGIGTLGTDENNGSFTNVTGANATEVIEKLNTNAADYDYQWQASTDGGYPVLVKK